MDVLIFDPVSGMGSTVAETVLATALSSILTPPCSFAAAVLIAAAGTGDAPWAGQQLEQKYSSHEKQQQYTLGSQEEHSWSESQLPLVVIVLSECSG